MRKNYEMRQRSDVLPQLTHLISHSEASNQQAWCCCQGLWVELLRIYGRREQNNEEERGKTMMTCCSCLRLRRLWCHHKSPGLKQGSSHLLFYSLVIKSKCYLDSCWQVYGSNWHCYHSVSSVAKQCFIESKAHLKLIYQPLLLQHC